MLQLTQKWIPSKETRLCNCKKMKQKRIAKLKLIVDIHAGSIFFYLQSKPLHIISDNFILLWLIYAGNFIHWNCLVSKVADLVYFNALKAN